MSGNDTLDGGAGSDWADYNEGPNGRSVGVTVVLDGVNYTTVQVNGIAEDSIRNIENITGGTLADSITGDTFDNILQGNSGDDTLAGGQGNDMLYGGPGTDTIRFSGSSADYLVNYDEGSDLWTVQDTVSDRDGTDTITRAEFFGFADGDRTAESYDCTVSVTCWKSGAGIEGVISTFIDNGIGEGVVAQAYGGGQYGYTGFSGNYTLTATKSDVESDSDAVDVDDAVAAFSLAVGENAGDDGSDSSSFRYLAADVNRDGSVGFRDTVSILKMALGRDDAPEPEWVIVPESSGSVPMDSGNVIWPSADMAVTLDQDKEIDLVGVLLGDVNGSWGN